MIELLENLYREHREGLFTFALSIVQSADLAEDAVQNAFANLIRQSAGQSVAQVKGHETNGQQPIAVGYLFRTVRNAAIDLVRSDTRKRRLSESLFVEFRSTDESAGPAQSLLIKERNEILGRAIDELADADREAVVLKFFAGLTFDQAGEATGTPPKTMASRYRRAIVKLENHLKGQL